MRYDKSLKSKVMGKKEFINNLILSGAVKTPRIIKAFEKIDRKDFVPEDLVDFAYDDSPLPIGFGQTISQPSTVAFMLELLQPNEADKILDVGSGSGWQTALLCQIVGQKGKVFAVEIIPELKEMGFNNTMKYNFVRSQIARFMRADGSRGLPEYQPFDKIIAAAYADKIPDDLKTQLKIGGSLVMPVKNSIFLVNRLSDDKFSESGYPGFVFVPLQNNNI